MRGGEKGHDDDVPLFNMPHSAPSCPDAPDDEHTGRAHWTESFTMFTVPCTIQQRTMNSIAESVDELAKALQPDSNVARDKLFEEQLRMQPASRLACCALINIGMGFGMSLVRFGRDTVFQIKFCLFVLMSLCSLIMLGREVWEAIWCWSGHAEPSPQFRKAETRRLLLILARVFVVLRLLFVSTTLWAITQCENADVSSEEQFIFNHCGVTLNRSLEEVERNPIQSINIILLVPATTLSVLFLYYASSISRRLVVALVVGVLVFHTAFCFFFLHGSFFWYHLFFPSWLITGVMLRFWHIQENVRKKAFFLDLDAKVTRLHALLHQAHAVSQRTLPELRYVNQSVCNLLNLTPSAVHQFSNTQADQLRVLQQRFANCVNTTASTHGGGPEAEFSGLSDVDDISNFQSLSFLSPFAPPHPADGAYRRYRHELQQWSPVQLWRVLLMLAIYGTGSWQRYQDGGVFMPGLHNVASQESLLIHLYILATLYAYFTYQPQSKTWLLVRRMTSLNVMVVIFQLFVAVACGNSSECTTKLAPTTQIMQSIWLWVCFPFTYPKWSQSVLGITLNLKLCAAVGVFVGFTRCEEQVKVFVPLFAISTLLVTLFSFSVEQVFREMFCLQVVFAKEQANALAHVFDDLSFGEPIQDHVRFVGDLIAAGLPKHTEASAALEQLQQVMLWQTFFAERSVIAFQVIKGNRISKFDTISTVPVRRVLHAAELMFFANPHHSSGSQVQFQLRFDPEIAEWVDMPELLVLHGLRVLLDSAIKQTESRTITVKMTTTANQELLFEVIDTGVGHAKLGTDATSGKGDVNWRRVPVSRESLNLWLFSQLLAAAGGSFGVSRVSSGHGRFVSNFWFRVPFEASHELPSMNIPASWRQVGK